MKSNSKAYLLFRVLSAASDMTSDRPIRDEDPIKRIRKAAIKLGLTKDETEEAIKAWQTEGE